LALDMTVLMGPFFWVAVLLAVATPGLIALGRRDRGPQNHP
jgi:hypothetical protein